MFVHAETNDGRSEADTTAALNVAPAVARSAVLPGWGQIYQERLLPAFLLYASSATFYYRGFFYLHRYRQTNKDKYFSRFKANMSGAVFLHLVNIIDAWDAGVHEKPRGWQGSLLGDLPPKSPWGGVLRSAILPGWGQVYNESYWKAAGYLAVNAYLLYRAHLADVRYRTTDRTLYRDRRSRFSWYFGLAYVVNMADAFAGAYLYEFDEAMRLTVSPQIMTGSIMVRIHVQF